MLVNLSLSPGYRLKISRASRMSDLADLTRRLDNTLLRRRGKSSRLTWPRKSRKLVLRQHLLSDSCGDSETFIRIEGKLMTPEAELTFQLKEAISQRERTLREAETLRAQFLKAREREDHLEKALAVATMKLGEAKKAWEASEEQTQYIKGKLKNEVNVGERLTSTLVEMEKKFNYLAKRRAELEDSHAKAKNDVNMLKSELADVNAKAKREVSILEKELGDIRRLAAVYPWRSFSQRRATKVSDQGPNSGHQLDWESILVCQNCGSKDNIFLDLLCRSCGFSFMNFGFLSFLLLALFLSGAGVLVGYARNPGALFAVAQVMLLIYLFFLLRRKAASLVLAGSIQVVASTAVFAFFFQHFEVPLLFYAPAIGVLIFFLVLACTMVYLWYNNVKQRGTGLIRGIGILSFLFFLFSLTLIGCFETLKILVRVGNLGFLSRVLLALEDNGSHINFLDFHRLRAAMLAVCIGYVLVLALAETFQRRIPKPAPLFAPASSVLSGISVSGQAKSRAAILFFIMYKILLAVFRYTTAAIKASLSYTKIGLEYVMKYAWAFVVELIILLSELIETLVSVLRNVLRRCFLPMAAALSLAVVGSLLAFTEYQYLFDRKLPSLWSTLLTLIAILVALPLFLWSLDRVPLSSVADSVSSSNFITGFVLLVSSLVSSLFLWALAQFLPGLPYETAGPFLKYGSTTAVVSVILVGLYNSVLYGAYRRKG